MSLQSYKHYVTSLTSRPKHCVECASWICHLLAAPSYFTGPGAGMRGIRGSTPGSTRGRGRGQRPRKNSQEAAASDKLTHPGDRTRQVSC